MRMLIVAVIGLSSPAFADRTGGGHPGGGGGSGPLGQVSAGLATASASAGTQRGSGGTVAVGGYDRAGACERYFAARAHDPMYRETILEHDCRGYVIESDPSLHQTAEGGATSEPGATVSGFAGAQKVIGSDGSVSLALAVADRRFRLDGTLTQYYETEMTGARVTMMAPEVSAGVHLGADGPGRAWLTSGVMYLSTSDPAGSSSNAGPTLGTRFEYRASKDLTFAGTVEAAWLQDGVRGLAGRVGVRFHHVEAALRVLDLNVGPALYGPELGVGF